MVNNLKKSGYYGLLIWMPVLACGELQQLGPTSGGGGEHVPTNQNHQESSVGGEASESDTANPTGDNETDDTTESGMQDEGSGEDETEGQAESEDETGSVSEDDPYIDFDFECLKIDKVQSPKTILPAGLRINFRVTDCDGDPAPPLGQSDFLIINDEKDEAFGLGLEGGGFSQLGIPSSYALYSVLALDMSESIFRTDSVSDVVSGALSYLESIDESVPSGVIHEVAVVAFGRPDAFEVIQDFSQDRAQLRKSILELESGSSRGSTDLYGTYREGLAMLSRRGQEFELSEKFFVLFSDGTHEAGNEEELRGVALEARDDSDANIYSIGIEGNYDSERLQELSSAPSNFLHVRDANELSMAFRRVAKRVEAISNSNYSVGVCTPVSLGEPSLTIRVGMSRQDGQIAQAEVRVPYSVAALDGDVGSCFPEDISGGKLLCLADEDFDGDGELDEVCEPVCGQMQCGCDLGVSCGTCGRDQVCSGEFQCVEEGGTTSGDSNGMESCGDGSTESVPEGIALGEVRANQGVAIPVWRDGMSTPAESRKAPIIAGRKTMLTAAWNIDETWIPRSVRADLVIVGAQGEVEVVSDTQDIAAASVIDDFEHSFSWRLGPEQVGNELQYRIELHELGSSRPSQDGISEFNESHPGIDVELAVVAGRNEIELVLVPVTHQSENCSKTPTAIEELGEQYSQFLLATYPVRAVKVQTRSTPILHDGLLNGDGWVQLLGNLSQRRSQDGALDHQFYHGVIDPCGTTNGIAGIGYVPPNPSLRAMAPYRTSLGLVSDWTLAHELGHNMGRQHVACSGREANPDAMYPYSGGKIGVWGIDLRDGLPDSDAQANQLRVSPIHNDFMSYCGDKWMSDYGWNFAHQTIVGMESWIETEQGRELQRHSLRSGQPMALVGLVQEDGRSYWWTEAERHPEQRAVKGPNLQLYAQDKLVNEVATQYVALSDDRSVAVRAILPDQAAAITHFAYESPMSPMSAPQNYARSVNSTRSRSHIKVSMEVVQGHRSTLAP